MEEEDFKGEKICKDFKVGVFLGYLRNGREVRVVKGEWVKLCLGWKLGRVEKKLGVYYVGDYRLFKRFIILFYMK